MVENVIRGNGVVTCKSFDFNKANSLTVSIHSKIFIEQSPDNILTIETDENLFYEIQIEHKNSLEIKTNAGRQISPTECTILIKTNTLNSLNLSGKTEVKCQNTLTGLKFELISTGHSQIALQLDVNEMAIHSSGSINGLLLGNANILDIDINGLGQIDALNLNNKELKFKAGGSTKISTTASLIEGVSSGSCKLAHTRDAQINIINSGQFIKTKI